MYDSSLIALSFSTDLSLCSKALNSLTRRISGSFISNYLVKVL
nr:MAG TPA: hypothetical protein [Caudoviricetes sp.]